MSISAKTVRAQLTMLQPLLRACSLETTRKGYNKLGEIMKARQNANIVVKKHTFSHCEGAWVVPNDLRRQGAILYLHGGGYTCGDLQYAMGFGATLASRYGMRTFCTAYRLAPENPYPAALEDALESYQYLLSKGYAPDKIALCGESAGGGLCYALCLKLKTLALPLPGGVIAISPWTDLTASGSSYEENKEIDPTITHEMLDFFADSYTGDRKDPYVSPMFGDLTSMPPSLIFVGGEEIMRSDSVDFHKKLQKAGCKSELIVKPDRWHAYLLYGLSEDRKDFAAINRFLNRYVSQENKLRWMPLDNAAKIYPAAQRKKWSCIYRVDAYMNEEVDVQVLRSALDVTVRRFPSIAARVCRGMFWYHLQQVDKAPDIKEENSYPLAEMTRRETRKCALRVIVYKKRIALEMFHSLTDGSGSIIFLKTLLAEYIQQKYGIYVPATEGVLDRLKEPGEEELEDSFQKYAGPVSTGRKGKTAWRLFGIPDDFVHVTCLKLSADELYQKAKELGLSVSVFLCAVMMDALQTLQAEKIPNPMHRKPIKVMLPVNLRRIFPSTTLRNFSLYIHPEIDPRLGRYSFEELCNEIKARMAQEVNPKYMSTVIAANVNTEHFLALRVVPLFIKNYMMRMAFDAIGDRKSGISLSNLGVVKLPEAMMPYVDRMDVILGVPVSASYNCGVVTFKDTVYINFTRKTKEPELEYEFFKVLRRFGLSAEAESNG